MSPASENAIERRIATRNNLFFLSFEVCHCLVRAWLIKIGNGLAKVNLPPVGNLPPLSARGFAFALGLSEAAVIHGARWTGRKCFFRAFILAHILRRRGLPVSLNVGLCGLNGRQNGRTIDGHCWLTLDDRPYLEDGDWREKYPDFLATGQNGIRYWIGTTAPNPPPLNQPAS